MNRRGFSRRQALSGALGLGVTTELLATRASGNPLGALEPGDPRSPATGISLSEALAQESAMAKASRRGAPGPWPTLATPEQLYAERLTLAVLGHPAVRSAREATVLELRGHPNSQSADGVRDLDHTVLLWTTTFIMQKVGERISPAFLVNADDTPHAWFGLEFPGVGISGDNPDNIYRVAAIDGARRYEVHGQLPAYRSAQLTVDLSRAMIGGGNTGARTIDLGTQIRLLRDQDLQISPDGRFTITVGPTDAPGDHMRSEPGRLAIWVRESKSDWRQPPVKLSIRCIDGEDRPAPDVDTVAADVAGGLCEWCDRWAGFRMTYLGRPAVNTMSPPISREGAWGFLAGGRWELGPDEAIIAMIDPQNAGYFSFHLTDPWAITFDARTTISARNNSQTTRNADGSATYVVSAHDPGVRNWINTAGRVRGELRCRWQKLPPTFDPATAIRRYQKVAFADLPRELPALVGVVSPEARRAELQARARDYDTRWTA